MTEVLGVVIMRFWAVASPTRIGRKILLEFIPFVFNGLLQQLRSYGLELKVSHVHFHCIH